MSVKQKSISNMPTRKLMPEHRKKRWEKRTSKGKTRVLRPPQVNFFGWHLTKPSSSVAFCVGNCLMSADKPKACVHRRAIAAHGRLNRESS